MPDKFDDTEWKKIVDQANDEQRVAGLQHIADTLVDFRHELLKREFTERQAFVLVRDFFCILVEKCWEPDEE